MIERRSLNSRIARRVFILFVCSALLPIGITAWMSYRQVSNLITEERQIYLRDLSKSYGLALFERLQDAEVTLRDSAYLAESAHSLLTSIEKPKLERMFDSVLILQGNSFSTLFGQPPAVLQHLRPTESDGSQLSVLPDEEDKPRVILSVPIALESGTAYALGIVKNSYVLPDTAIPENTDICVLDSRKNKISCYDNGLFTSVKDVKSQLNMSTQRNFTWQDQDHEYIASFWDLFLDHQFKSRPWTIVASQRKDRALATLQRFRTLYIPLLGLSLLSILLFSVRTIRRSLKPINSLIVGARHISAGELRHRIDIDSHDEFSELAVAFNDMAKVLNSHREQETSQTEIDQLILTGNAEARIARAILQGLNNVYPYQRASIYFDATRTLHSRPATLTLESLPLEPSVFIAASHKSSTPVPIEDILSEPAVVSMYGAGHCAYMPLITQGKLLGGLIIQTENTPSEPVHQAALDAFINRSTIALSALAREKQLTYQATYDLLTQIPNRTLLKKCVQDAIEAYQSQHGLVCAMLFIDIDRFKQVNDVHGHHVGDLLLKQISQRLQSVTPEQATLARYGGDEFILFIPDTSVSLAEQAARAILKSTEAEFHLGSVNTFVSASVGISFYPTHAHNYDELLQRADTAMYYAKAAGRNRLYMYNEDMTKAGKQRADLEYFLRSQVKSHHIEVFYQAKVCASTGQLEGFEALMRCKHPDFGYISPALLIPIAEETGLIHRLGLQVMRDAMNQCLQWREEGKPVSSLAVNISPVQLFSTGFIGQLHSVLSETGFNPEHLELEITESILINQLASVCSLLEEIRALGVRISLDDFGTGYSSLSYFGKLPIDVLKIDRSFVIPLETEQKQVEIIRCIIDLAHTFDIKVVAEGVETEGQLKMLQQLGCDEIQGFYFSRPLPGEEAGQLAPVFDLP